jgi:hypothetical protein
MSDSDIEEESYESDDDTNHDFVEDTPYNCEIIIVKNENRVTSHVLSIFEQTQILTIRIKQLRWDGIALTDITGLTDAASIAKRELMMRKTPIMLRRYVGAVVTDGKKRLYYEDWDPNVMEFSFMTAC